MKLLFLSIAITFSLVAKSQVSAVSLKASGLTCSMCSNAINKALKTLDFVDKVEADIKTYTFDISFKAGSSVDFDKIKKKVEDAGFSVSGFTAAISFSNVQISPGAAVSIGHMSLYFLNGGSTSLNGITQIRILNKGFVSTKEYKQNNIPKQSLTIGAYYATIN